MKHKDRKPNGKPSVKVLRYIRRYRIYFVASILLASVNVFGTLMIPKLVGEARPNAGHGAKWFYEGPFAIEGWRTKMTDDYKRNRVIGI